MKRVLKTDLYVRVDFEARWARGNLAEYKSTDAELFLKFIKDHRSQDIQDVRIAYDYETICSHCNMNWTEDDGKCNWCCDEEINEYHEKLAEPFLWDLENPSLVVVKP